MIWEKKVVKAEGKKSFFFFVKLVSGQKHTP